MSELAQNPDAERALLGACLLSDTAIEEATALLTAQDFHGPGHAAIFAAIVQTHARGKVDPVTVNATRPDLDLERLVELMNNTPTTSNAGKYAAMVADCAHRRALILAANEAMRLANGEQPTDDAHTAAETIRTLFAELDRPTGKGAPDPDAWSYLATVDTEHDWLVPDFLERRDRMLITAGEGAGKSLLITQIAVQVAAGVHPFKLHDVTPRNVTIIDLENSDRMVARRVDTLTRVAGTSFDPHRLRIHVRTAGINLCNPTDRRWLLDRCIANNTELLVIGPTYRMAAGVAAKGDVGAEDQARIVTGALDEIRHRCNVAMLLETHAPHGNGFGRDLRPFGSSVWLRWPEFGFGLRGEPEQPNRYAVEHFRGPRDHRTWPEHLAKGAGRWPWMPEGMPPDTFNRGGQAA